MKQRAPIVSAKGAPGDAAPGASKTIAGIGRVLPWSGGSLWIGHDAGRGQVHAHHAIQISLALTGRVRLRGELPGEWSGYAAAIVRSHHRHQFDGCGQTVAQIFVEPECMHGRALMARLGDTPIEGLPIETVAAQIESLRTAYATGSSDDVLVAASHRLLTQLCGSEQAPRTVDPRITRAIEFVRSRLNAPPSLAEAAAAAHLSPSRFRHLFVAQTGITFRAYLLWARIASAMGAGMAGASWTEAAQDWGFADSAHLSRTCRRMFGIAPSMLIRQ